MKTIKSIILFAAATLLMTTTHATVIYQDGFGGTAAPLEGRLAESGGSAGEEWLTKEGFETDGSIAFITTNASRSAALPFLPMAGERYRLSADISVAVDAWAAFGFIAESNVVNGREFFFNLIDSPAPWINLKPDGTLNTFGGPLTGNKVSFSGMGTNGTIMIELDTRSTNWVATYYFNGSPLRTNTFSGALYEINYVGFGNYSPADMTVDNFKLETVDQSAEVSITHTTFVPISPFANLSNDVDFFHRYLDEFDVHSYRFREDSDWALQQIKAFQDNYGYRISCTTSDLMYTNGTQSGEICAQIVLDSVARFYSFSGEVSRLYIDHPWMLQWVDKEGDSVYPGEVVPSGLTEEQAVDEVIDFMDAIHDEYPNWEFYLMPNFSNWGWKGERAYRTPTGETNGLGDFYTCLTMVYSNALAAGLSLDGVIMDAPYDIATGISTPEGVFYNGNPSEIDWMARIRDIENEVESRGMKFALVNNTKRGPAYVDGTYSYFDGMDYIDVYTGAPYYGTPSLYSPRTWLAGKPPEMVPEICLINGGTSNYTMSAIVNATIDRVKRPEIEGSFQAFNIDGNNQGWVLRSDISDYSITNGYYIGATDTTNAYIGAGVPGINGNTHSVVEIAMATTTGTTARFSYKVDGNTTWRPSTDISLIADSEIHVYTLDMSTNSVWMSTQTNRIRNLRIDPSDITGTEFAIDYIWIHPDFD